MRPYSLRCLSSSALCDVRFYLSTWNIESAFGLHAFYNMSGFICMPNRAPHDYPWNLYGFFIICIRWLLFLFLFLPYNLYTPYHLYFVARAQFSGWVNPAGVLRMAVAECFIVALNNQWFFSECQSGWKSLYKRNAWDHFPQKSWKFDHYLGSAWTVRKTTCQHDKFWDFINSLFWSPNILFPKKPFWMHRPHVQRALMVMFSNSFISPWYHG